MRAAVPPPPAVRARSAAARCCDALLDFGVLVFAAWTLGYHLCLALDGGAGWALAVMLAALVPSAVLAARRPAAPAPGGERARPRPRTAALIVAVSAAAAAAVVFAFADAPWPVTWALWIVGAAAALIWTSRTRPQPRATAPAGPIAAATWAVVLGALSLFLVRPDGDDAYYLRSATWIAEHGRFPLRDVLYSDEELRALFFPPMPSYEGLLGTLARVTQLSSPDLAYYAVTPLVSALSVLAVWRLLRTWRVRTAGLALTVAMVFLLTSAPSQELVGQQLDNHLPGGFFVARAWQGKVILVALLVPVLLALLHGYAERPSARGLVLLAAAGAAAVGLSTTGIFLVPVIAIGCLAPIALRSPTSAALGAGAALAYPVAAAAATLAVGGHTPVTWPASVITPEVLLPPALGSELIGLLALGAALAGPLLLGAPAGRMVASTVLLVGCLFAPGVPALVYDLTGLGKPLWRLVWAIPAAALVGVFSTQLVPSRRAMPVRALPAIAVCGALAAWGVPVWDGAGTRVTDRPVWKRPAHVTVAREILAAARAGDLVLAPPRLSQTLVIASATVTTVAPRIFYTRVLAGGPSAYRRRRLLLARFAIRGLGEPSSAPGVRRALRVLDVDIACVPAARAPARRLLTDAGYVAFASTSRIWCARQLPRTTG